MLVIFFALLLTFNTLFASSVFAQKNGKTSLTVKSESVDPSDGTFKYGFKRLKENIALSFYGLFPAKKAKYMRTLVGVRLSEFKNIIDNNDKENIEKTSQRYFTTIGKYVEYLKLNPSLSNEKNDLKILLTEHYDYISPLKNKYVYESAEWLFIKQVMDYILLYQKQL